MDVVDPDAIHALARQRCGKRSARRSATHCSPRTAATASTRRRSVAHGQGHPPAAHGRAWGCSPPPTRRKRRRSPRRSSTRRQHDRPPGRARRARFARRARSARPRSTPFTTRFRDDPLVLDKWFALQAAAQRADTVDQVLKLAQHPDFMMTNPNRLRVAGRHVRRQPLGVPLAPTGAATPSSPT